VVFSREALQTRYSTRALARGRRSPQNQHIQTCSAEKWLSTPKKGMIPTVESFASHWKPPCLRPMPFADDVWTSVWKNWSNAPARLRWALPPN
jgi:hypothetical protein